MNKDVEAMIDLETIGTGPRAVVLEAGMVAFTDSDVIQSSKKNVLFDVQQQIDDGRNIDWDTVGWWLDQEQDAIDAVLKNRSEFKALSPGEALEEIREWLHSKAIDVAWCKGPSFDAAIFHSLSRDYDVPDPVDFWNWRDVRTAKDLTGVKDVEPDLAHSAASDAVAQAKTVINARHRINKMRERISEQTVGLDS